jgi:[acyl-carrier-protein] S-malonyltransferase
VVLASAAKIFAVIRYALLCPGQGAQHAGSFALVSNEPAAAPVLAAARSALGHDPSALVADRVAACANQNAQPLIVAAALAAWRALERDLPPPDAIAGYSVGELSAYGCAESFELDDLFGVVGERARLMSEAAPPGSGLVSVRGAPHDSIRALCASTGVHVAIVIAAEHCVVGGARAGLERFIAAATTQGALVRELPVTIPAHTPLLEDAATRFRRVLAESTLTPPRHLVLSGIDGRARVERAPIVEALAAQVAAPVSWDLCMRGLIERRCTLFLELPPGRALSQMLRDQFPDVEARAVEEFRSLDGARDWLSRRLR